MDSSVDGDGGGVDGEAFRGHFPVPRRAGTDCPPDLGFAMARLWNFLSSQNESQMLFMLFFSLGIDENVINEHYDKLVESVTGSESSLGNVRFPNLELMMEPIIPTEPFIQTQVYDLANGGDLIFERDLFALTEFLGRSPPVFYGGQITDQANGQLQWLIMANLPGKPESPMFRLIQFSLRDNTWVDGLARALQEALARLCGQNSVAIEGERFAHFARHSSVGLPLSLPYHPVLRHHVDHLDYMLFETRSALDNSRAAANHTQQQLNQYAETIKVIAKERRTLRQLVAKRDSTIHRLKTKISVLKETISTQAEQLQILEGEGEGEDIQGDGYSYVSNDNDYEEEEDMDFHQHLPAGMDTTFPLRIDG
ncbi:hypothetical protein QYE76_042990 [Lolium multiflorum]|uniref:Uncharacterized protein n=1 Tax=Lolium multiflorum TaxID=4521 RepID=A0AAD8WV62_LOLMU|nr:hypothetical protein QYE76_042990 [Lolium multiflorum]